MSHPKLACLAAGTLLVASCAAPSPPRVAAGPPLTRYDIPAPPDSAPFDAPSVVFLPPSPPAASPPPLVVFLPGTTGRPDHIIKILSAAAAQGYRALGIEYNDTPAVAQMCPDDPAPGCSETFRQMRVDGTGAAAPVHNPLAQAIIPRLVAALRTLAKDHPDQAWSTYLAGNAPAWPSIVVSGLSQGAGMAAYIAKHHQVARVVLFSSPWDTTGPDHHPAPWLTGPAATPPDRWFAEFHTRERTAREIQAAYAALSIPPEHIQLFTRDLPAGIDPDGPNPYHGSTIQNPAYAPQWRILFGTPN